MAHTEAGIAAAAGTFLVRIGSARGAHVSREGQRLCGAGGQGAARVVERAQARQRAQQLALDAQRGAGLVRFAA